ncbi:MAG: CoA-binding protein [Pseudomonadota bacterium]
MTHDRYDDTLIRSILEGVKTVAMVGASANTVRPSYFVLTYLVAKGYKVFPINPGRAGHEIAGQRCYASLADVPEPIDMVDVFRAAEAVPAVLDEVLALEPLPRVLWLQLGVRNDNEAARAEAAGLTVIQNKCPKIEFGRLSGEISWAGVNTQRVSAKRPQRMAGFQRLGIGATKPQP